MCGVACGWPGCRFLVSGVVSGSGVSCEVMAALSNRGGQII